MDASLGSLAFSSIIGPETLCLMGARAAHITPTICPGGELYYQGNASKHRTISRATVLSCPLTLFRYLMGSTMHISYCHGMLETY